MAIDIDLAAIAERHAAAEAETSRSRPALWNQAVHAQGDIDALLALIKTMGGWLDEYLAETDPDAIAILAQIKRLK